MFLIFYLALRNPHSAFTFLLYFGCFILFSLFSTTYGYLVNDLADKELDAIHDKENTFSGDSKPRATLVVLLFFALSAIFALPFVRNPVFLIAWVCWIFCTTFYSLPPLRFKERGKSGLLLAVCAQRLFPITLIFVVFGYYNWADILVLSAYVFCRGSSSDLNHQLEDYHNDVSTSTGTYAVEAGFQRTARLLRVSLEAEKALLILCLLIMTLNLATQSASKVPLLLPLLFFYLLIYGMSLSKIRSLGAKPDVNPFAAGRKDIFQFIHHAFPSVVVPLYLLLLLSWQNWLYIPILLFFVWFRNLYSFEVIRRSFQIGKLFEISKAVRSK